MKPCGHHDDLLCGCAERPTACRDCGAPLYRATDAYVVVCHACGRDFVTSVHNDYLLTAAQYGGAG